MTLRTRRVRVDMQLPEVSPQRFLLFQTDFLVAEEQHLMFRQRGMQIIDLPVGQRRRQVDVRNLGTQTRGERLTAMVLNSWHSSL